MEWQLTSESVTEGHPDKVADYVSDSILDAHIAADPNARVACEVLCKGDQLVLAGEVTSTAEVDHEAVARHAVREIGYVDPAEDFCADTVRVHRFISQQAGEIAQGVEGRNAEAARALKVAVAVPAGGGSATLAVAPAANGGHGAAATAPDAGADQGAGDQGIMFGYATDETPELMPLPILLAHRLTRGLAEDRKSGRIDWLRPDGKSQVTVTYRDGAPVRVENVLVSTQHDRAVSRDTIRDYVVSDLAPRVLGDWFHHDIDLFVNPTGSFVQGGPSADAGVTGRKIIVDTYGGAAKHGGGAFSGKDPSKVDRSGAYFCRHVAREIVKAGIARRAEIQVAYAIGVARPTSVRVDTFGTGDELEAADFVLGWDFRPRAIVERLRLLRPLYRSTTSYGHFGKPELPWEA